jgi:hypothetical protein
MHFSVLRPNRHWASRGGGVRGRERLAVVLGGHVGDQVDDTLRVSPLVIVPRDQLDKVVVERDTGLGIKDGRVRVADKVSGDNIVLSVAENALEDCES